MSLFNTGQFKLHSGKWDNFKIDCDFLTDIDIDSLAIKFLEMIPHFGKVESIPSGGDRLAKAMSKYVTPRSSTILIADDVSTTGASFESVLSNREDVIGICIFDRGQCPSWVVPMFRMSQRRR
jgi:hypothetical protein